MHSKERAQGQSKEQVQNSISVKSTEQLTVQPTVRSNDTYVYGVGMLVVLASGVCVLFAYNTFPKNKKQANEIRMKHQNKVKCFISNDLYNE